MVKTVEGIDRDGKGGVVGALRGSWGLPSDCDPVWASRSTFGHVRKIRPPTCVRLDRFAEDWDRSEMAAYDDLPPRWHHLGVAPGLKPQNRQAAARDGCPARPNRRGPL